ncbi:SRPBCC domain-containing protein [Paenibacillus sp. NPDC058071]|uniref:SRPBCC domain-containing protein n=1 Tax=Paenibacillus sp. NPDC058071 TaxID=3346326 RepID=UPI0036DA40D0
MTNAATTRVEGNTLIVERIFKAPRELVFKCYSEAEHLSAWWGPEGWSVPVCKVDFRPGGKWHYCMKCEDRAQGDFYGMESWGLGEYIEIQPPEKIVYKDWFSDAEGNIDANLPETLVALEFVELDDRTTKLINTATYISEEALRTVLDMGMLEGMGSTMARLDVLLEELQR